MRGITIMIFLALFLKFGQSDNCPLPVQNQSQILSGIQQN